MPLGGILGQRALALGVGFQRVVAIRMGFAGGGPLVPPAAHRHRVDDYDMPGAVAFRVPGHVVQEEAVFEVRVMRHERLLFKAHQQPLLRLRPFVEQAPLAAGAHLHVDAGQVADGLVAVPRVGPGDAEPQTRLAVRVARLIRGVHVGHARRGVLRAWRDHVHVFETDVDDVIAQRIGAGGFDVDAHDGIQTATRQVDVAPVRSDRGCDRGPLGIGCVAGGTARGDGTLQVSGDYQPIAGLALLAGALAAFGAAVDQFGRPVLDVIDRGGALGGLQHRHGDAFAMLVGNRPQPLGHAAVTQQIDLVVQSTVRMGERPRQPV